MDFDASEDRPHLTARGTLYATGKLAYDPAQEVLRITDLEYDVQTHNVLLHVANWLLAPSILRKVEGKTVVPLKPRLAAAMNCANEQLAKLKVPPGVNLSVAVSEFRLRDVQGTDDTIYLFFEVTGASLARLTPTPH